MCALAACLLYGIYASPPMRMASPTAYGFYRDTKEGRTKRACVLAQLGKNIKYNVKHISHFPFPIPHLNDCAREAHRRPSPPSRLAADGPCGVAIAVIRIAGICVASAWLSSESAERLSSDRRGAARATCRFWEEAAAAAAAEARAPPRPVRTLAIELPDCTVKATKAKASKKSRGRTAKAGPAIRRYGLIPLLGRLLSGGSMERLASPLPRRVSSRRQPPPRPRRVSLSAPRSAKANFACSLSRWRCSAACGLSSSSFASSAAAAAAAAAVAASAASHSASKRSDSSTAAAVAAAAAAQASARARATAASCSGSQVSEYCRRLQIDRKRMIPHRQAAPSVVADGGALWRLWRRSGGRLCARL